MERDDQLEPVLFAEDRCIKRVHLPSVPYFDEGMRGFVAPAVVVRKGTLPYVMVSISNIGEDIDVGIPLHYHSPHSGSDLMSLWRTMRIVDALEDVTTETLECALISGISFPKDDMPENLRDFTSVVTDQIGTDRYFSIMREEAPDAGELERAFSIVEGLGVPVTLEPICELVSLKLLFPTEDLERAGVSTLERLIQRRKRCEYVIGNRFQPMISHLIYAWDLPKDSPLIRFLCNQIISVLLSGITDDEVVFGCALVIAVEVMTIASIQQLPVPSGLPEYAVREAQARTILGQRMKTLEFLSEYFDYRAVEEYEGQLMEIVRCVSGTTPDHRNLDRI